VSERKGLVTSIDAWTYSPGNTGLFGLSATADEGKFEAARDAMLEEVDRMKSELILPGELNKAVKQFLAGTLAVRKTMQGQAQDIGGSWLAANDLNFSERYLAAVKRVTPAEIQRVATQYLTPDNRTIYALLPAGTAPKSTLAATAAEEHPIQKFEFPNGLRLLVKEDHRLPFVEIRTVFKGGVLVETEETNGITQLTGKMLLKGTRTRSAEQIASEIESVGGSIDSYGGNNSFGLNVEVMSSDFDLALEMARDVLLEPTFPESELARECEVQLAAIRAQKDQLLPSAFKAARRALFDASGYGLDTLGTEESVQALQVADLKTFHQSYAVPANCVLAIFGDVTTAKVCSAVEKAFGGWQPADPERSTLDPRPSPPLNSLRRITEVHDKKQAVIVIAFRGTTLLDADRYALELLQESCSDLGSRLFLRIREQLGLAYYVGAQNFVGLVPGYFAFYVGTTPEKTDLVEKELFNEAELLRLEGLTEQELYRSKAKVIGQKKIARQDLGHLAMVTALDELYGLGFRHLDTEDAHYEAVSMAQVKAVAQKYLRTDALVIATFKPADKEQTISASVTVES